MDEQQAQFAFPAERKIWTVSELAARLKQELERDYFDVWIEGEISNLHSSPARHYYFTLKDAGAQLRAAMFASSARYLKFRLQDGQQVLVRGRISLYQPRGDLQCLVEYVEPRGAGGLQLAFEQLKSKLAAEGLFAPERKRPLPMLPRRVGIVTSPRGAAIADMTRVLRRRYPNLGIVLYPVQVQGAAAAGEICAALAYFGRMARGRPELLIVGRGGGSIEDLWAFNEERVARALAASPIPVISAVGHETDFTIADFVADLRAPTPSAAAELAVRPKRDLVADCREWRRRLVHSLRYRLLQRRQLLGELTQHRAFPSLRGRLRERQQMVDDLSFRLRQEAGTHLAALWRRLEAAAARVRAQDARRHLALLRQRRRHGEERLWAAYRLRLVAARSRVENLRRVLEERNPLAILGRGYALVYDAKRSLVADPARLAPGDLVAVRMASGWIEAQVRRVRPVNDQS